MNRNTRKPTKTDIRQIKQRLESDRKEALTFLHRVEQERQNLDDSRPAEMGDFCIQTASREYLFERSSQQRQLLRRVEAALRRIESGTFGECVACGDEINHKRLAAMPWTDYCIRCQEDRERHTTPPHASDNVGRSENSVA